MTTRLNGQCLASYDEALSGLLCRARENVERTRNARRELMLCEAETLEISNEMERIDRLYYEEKCGLAGCACCEVSP
jgi:hypothetical protein